MDEDFGSTTDDVQVTRPAEQGRILLIEDDELVKLGLIVGLREQSNTSSRFEFSLTQSVAAAVTMTDSVPQLIMLDVRLGGGSVDDSLAALDTLREHFPKVPVALLSVSDSPRLLCGALERGAAGVLPRKTPLPIIAIAIDLMMAGGVYLPPQFAALLNTAGSECNPEPHAKRQPGELTGRQQAILDLLAGGASNKEIALRLRLSVGTVKNYVSGLLRMMQKPTRNRLVAHLRQRGGEVQTERWSSNRAELLRGWMSDVSSHRPRGDN